MKNCEYNLGKKLQLLITLRNPGNPLIQAYFYLQRKTLKKEHISKKNHPHTQQ